MTEISSLTSRLFFLLTITEVLIILYRILKAINLAPKFDHIRLLNIFENYKKLYE